MFFLITVSIILTEGIPTQDFPPEFAHVAYVTSSL